MISSAVAFFALVGAAVAVPHSHAAPVAAPMAAPAPAPAPAATAAPTAAPMPSGPGVSGELASGASFTGAGDTVSGAAADKDSGVAASALEGIGSVLSLAGPGLATGAALASPSL